MGHRARSGRICSLLVGTMLLATSSARAQSCAPDPALTEWLQAALGDWHRLITEDLSQPARPLPWMVLFDTRCVYHLGAPPSDLARLDSAARPIPTSLTFDGQPVGVAARLHGDTLRLPSGSAIPVAPLAFTSSYRGDSATFFTMALPDIWRQDPRFAADSTLDDFFRGVMAHELTHTRQLVGVIQEITELAKRGPLPPNLNDDVVQDLFGADTAYFAAYDREYALLKAAAFAATRDERRRLGREALQLARERRDRFFRGEHANLRELEDVFLFLEGSGGWAFLQVARRQMPAGTTMRQTLERVMSGKRFWVQEQGGVLFLLLDAELPDWKARAFGPRPPSVFTLWDEATRPTPSQ